MAHSHDILVLPRPDTQRLEPHDVKSIPAPNEEAFIRTFGKLLPPAKFLSTLDGKAAYYELPPSSSTAANSSAPDRVVFIHGVQTPAIGQLPLARALHESFPHAHFVLLELWGHGLSDTPIRVHTPGLFLQLLDQLLRKLGWHSAHLIGYSFGGSTAASYLASRSSRVQSLVLIAPAGLLRSSEFSPEEQALLRGNGDEVAARDWIVQWLEGGKLVVPSDWQRRIVAGQVVAEAVRDWQTREHAGHTASVVAIFRDGGVLDRHSEFAKAAQTGVPVSAVLGELDDVCSVQDLKEQGLLDVATVPGVGHGVVRERVPEVAKLIAGFWNTLKS